jgi:hypothetical protein
MRGERERQGLIVVNAKRVYRIMRVHGLLLQRRPVHCAHSADMRAKSPHRRATMLPSLQVRDRLRQRTTAAASSS